VRRLVVVISAVFTATFLVSIAALSAQAEPADRQYEPSDGSETSVDTSDTSGTSGEGSFVSQGSAGGDTPEALAAQADLAEEDRLPDYSQVVDNSTRGRFVAPGWEHISGNDGSHGADYAVARAGSGAKKATFRVKVPTNNDYAVYAWWTAARKNASDARFVISTASGAHTEKVDETKEGGMWIKLGDFEMKKGERTVQVSPSGDAAVVADAVAIVRGAAPPPEETTFSAEGGDTLRTTATRSAANGRDIVRVAKRYIGTSYRYATCTRSAMSCTCETKKAVAPFGHRFPMTELGQWRYEPSRQIRNKSNLKPGDIVFFREPYPPSGIDHVGVYSGGGNLVHSSSYFNKVVESQMKYIKGYTGAIRVNPR
jgi:cell wall-associated NlpC family hydrolase